MKQKLATPMARMNNIVNISMTNIMQGEYLIVNRRKEELTERVMRAKGLTVAKGYAFMGNIHISNKHLMASGNNPTVQFIPLDYEFWPEGKEIDDRLSKIGVDRDHIKQLLVQHLMRVDADDMVKWLSALPKGLHDLFGPPYTDIERVYDHDFYKPGEPAHLAQWELLMQSIYQKLAMRLLV